MVENNVFEGLTSLELRVLSALKSIDKSLFNSDSLINVLIKETGLKQVEVMRGLQWLENKNIIKLGFNKKQLIFLDKNGLIAKSNGLPEKKILAYLLKKPASLDELKKEFSDAINFSIGILKKKLAVNIKKQGSSLIFSITDSGKKLLSTQSLEEKFLNLDFPIVMGSLTPEQKFAFDSLKKRKSFLRLESKTYPFILETDIFKALPDNIDSFDLIDKLTPEVLKSGVWKNKSFRRYDINADVPFVVHGREHFINEAIDFLKNIWIELGFEEMSGSKVQSAFWDMDALFVPQDHPARELQDTFYLDVDPAKLPEKLLNRVSAMHSKGDDDSRGWNYDFDVDISKRVMLRTHTTVLSAKYISKFDFSGPKKYFKIGWVYRNESLDWKHLFQFYQVEGIVIDENANFRNLLGYLMNFYKKLGYTHIRLRPAYFPYTEPSVEIEVFNESKKQWIELGGAGMIRPEVTKMLLGKEVPVLAWGQGLERGVTSYFNITDLRKLYSNDIKMLKTIPHYFFVD